MTPEQLLTIARRAVPTLTANGMYGTDELPPLDEIAICAAWIERFMYPRKTLNYRWSSYGLKHAVERDAKHYVCNGAFIAAAIGLGYAFRDEGGLNASFHAGYRERRCLRCHRRCFGGFEECLDCGFTRVKEVTHA